MGFDDRAWIRVTKFDHRALALADRHYSRQSPGSWQFLPPGETLAMVTRDGRAVWGVCHNMDPVGAMRWRVTIFRNEGPLLSSDLVREATDATVGYWLRKYGRRPFPLQTEVDPAKVRRKRDPGRCFLKAGWRRVGMRRGLVVLQAPELNA